MPAQPFHGVGAQPAGLHLLGEQLADGFHLRHLATAQHTTDQELLEAIAIAAGRSGERRRRPAHHRPSEPGPAADAQQEGPDAIAHGERAIDIERRHINPPTIVHRRLSIIVQKSGQLLLTTSGSSTMMPLAPRPNNANAIANRWS